MPSQWETTLHCNVVLIGWAHVHKMIPESTSCFTYWGLNKMADILQATFLNVFWYPGPRFNIKMMSYQYRKFHCGDKTILQQSYPNNKISYSGKTTSLYWIGGPGVIQWYQHCMKIHTFPIAHSFCNISVIKTDWKHSSIVKQYLGLSSINPDEQLIISWFSNLSLKFDIILLQGNYFSTNAKPKDMIY